MKKIICVGMMLISTLTFAQKRVNKIFEYKAINGVNYRIGDTILLNNGKSCVDGSFINVVKRGTRNLPRYYAHFPFIVTEIKQYNLDFGTIYEFRGKIGNSKPNRYSMLIDCAIESEEINFK